MEKFMRDTVLSGVDLVYLGTDRFDTGYLTISLLSPLSKKTAPYNAVLPSVLRRGTATYPDADAVENRLSELHAEITPFVRKRGDTQVFGFASRFSDGDFTGVAGLLSEMLAYPKTKNGRLLEAFVISEKEKLLTAISDTASDAVSHAQKRLLEVMLPKNDYVVPAYGTEDAANKISVATLTRHYHTILRESKMEIFYSGSLDFDTVKKTMVSAFSCLPRLIKYADIHTIPYESERDGIKTVTENSDAFVAALGFALGKNYHSTSLAALWVYDALLSVQGLCIYKEVDFLKGILTVLCDADDGAENALLRRVEDIRVGTFTDEELSCAKEAVIAALNGKLLKQEESERYYADTFAGGIFFTPAEMAELAETVGREDILFIAETVRPDTVLRLCENE